MVQESIVDQFKNQKESMIIFAHTPNLKGAYFTDFPCRPALLGTQSLKLLCKRPKALFVCDTSGL